MRTSPNSKSAHTNLNHHLHFIGGLLADVSHRLPLAFYVLFCLPWMLGTLTSAQTNVVTNRYDIARTALNANETQLTPADVNKATFGKLFTQTVDGLVYAQPLYLPNVTIPGKGSHNVIFVATQHDSVYAFDADSNSGANGTPLWQITLLDVAHGAANGATTVPQADLGPSNTDIIPEIGITSTPVIDPNTNTIYVVGKTKENNSYFQRLHALDVTTGAEKFGGPVQLQATVAGTGSGSSGGSLSFSPLWENQRPGLLLLNGVVYIAFAAHGDLGPWHGWVFGYNASTLAQTSVYCASCNDSQSGIWLSGSGIPSDGTYLYVPTGNGPFDASTTSFGDYGDSILKLGLSAGQLTVLDYFTPYNQSALQNADNDMASGGILLLPNQPGAHPHEMVTASKEGRIYVLDRDTLTANNLHYCSGCTSNPNIVQEIPGALGGMWGSPAYWNNTIYFWGKADFPKAFALSNGLLSTTPVVGTPKSNYPSPACSVSANGNTSGILWCINTDNSSDTGPAGPAILYAFDASNIKTELYDSTQNASDAAGGAVKFQVPVVMNGKVYVGAERQLNVYGLLNGMAPAVAPSISPVGSANLTQPVTVSITDATPGSTIYYTTNGVDPTTTSPIYTAQFVVSANTTVKAMATAPGFLQSPINTQIYSFAPTATPVISPTGSSNLTQPVTVSITDSTPGSTIYYTTTGVDPTTSSPVYNGSFSVSVSTTVKALAVAPGLSQSAISIQTYSFGNSGVPVATDAVASGDQGSSSTTVSSAAFSTTVPNELLLALVATDANSGTNTTVTGISGAGLPWTLVVRSNTQSGTSEIWRAFATTPLSNVNVTATLSTGVASSITVMSFKNVDATGTNGSGAIGAFKATNANSGAPTASLITTRNNSIVVGVGNDYDNAIARTPATGQSIVHQYLAPVGDTYWVQAINAAVPLSGTTVTLNDTAPTGDRYNLAIVEVLPSTTVASTYSISGTITPTANATGTTVTLSGPASLTANPDANGNYSFAGLASGAYTVTPTKAGFTFTPSNQSVTVGSANVTGINFTVAAIPTHTISGTITPLPNGTGVTVTLSGAASATVTSDSSGNFSFPGLQDGSYTVTPTKSGFSFSPTNKPVTVSGADVTGTNFTITQNTFSISGTVTPLANATGVTITLGGAQSASTTTDASGNYTFTALANGSYTITPSKSGFTFAPTSQSVTVSGANVGAVNFTSAAATFTISGSVSPLANGTGVTISLSGTQSGTTTTDASGNYTLSGLANGSYTVTPTKSGFTFSPSSQSVAVNGANVSAVNFTSAANTFSISGSVTPLANGTGVTMSLTGAQSASTTTDSSGNYSFIGVTNGSYTVTPTKTGFSFTPSSAPITISNASASAVNFTAQTVTPSSIAFDTSVSTDGTSANSALISPVFTTSSTNELLLAFVATDDPGSGTNITVTGVSGAGLTWTLVGRSNTQRGTSEIWRAFATTKLTGVSVTATLSKSVVASITVSSFTGASAMGTGGSGAIGAVSSANAATGAPAATLVTTKNNSLVVGVGNDYDNAIARTVGPNQSLVHQTLATVGDTYWVQRFNSPTSLSGTSVTLNDTAPTTDRFNLIICEILPAP